jgi:hypothetical protein
MTKPRIPFGWLPSHWGLKGKTRAVAEAEYNLTGLDLDLRLIELNESDPTQQEIKKLRARHQRSLISEYELDVETTKLTNPVPGQTRELALLDVEHKHNKITQLQYDKQRAEILEEPWVAMPNISWDPADPAKSFFELDYNTHFVDYLRQNGYEGVADEQIVEAWLTDICRAVATDFVETGDTFVATSVPTKRVRKGRAAKTEYS